MNSYTSIDFIRLLKINRAPLINEVLKIMLTFPGMLF